MAGKHSSLTGAHLQQIFNLVITLERDHCKFNGSSFGNKRSFLKSFFVQTHRFQWREVTIIGGERLEALVLGFLHRNEIFVLLLYLDSQERISTTALGSNQTGKQTHFSRC